MRRRVAITFVLCATVCCAWSPRPPPPGPSSPARPARRCCARGSPSRSIARAPRRARSTSTSSACARADAARGRCWRWRAARARLPRRTSSTGPSAFRSALRNRDLVVFDQRGTGLSGVLRCRSLFVPVTRTPLEQAQAAERCAQTLGPRRAYYTTRDSVDDIDAVRRAVGVDKITLFGVSYGTKVALGYAARYPQHVERLRARLGRRADRPGAFSQESLAAVPRVLRALCARGCEEITQGPARRSRGAAVLDARRAAVRTAGRRGRPAQARPDRPAAAAGAVVRRGLRPHAARRAARCPEGGPRGRHGPAAAARPAKRAGSGPDARPLPERRAVHGDRVRGGAAAVGPHDAGRMRGRPRPRRTFARCRPRPLGPFDRTTVLFGSAPFQLCSRWPTAPADRSCPTARSPPSPRSCSRARTTCAPRSSPRAGSRRGSRARPWSPCPRWATRC